MSNTIRVSAWGIRHALGPISLCTRDADGVIQWQQVTQGAADVSLGALPGHLIDTFSAHEFEIPDWYLNNADEAELAALRDALETTGSVLTTVTIDGRHVGDADPANREDDIRTIEKGLELLAALNVSSARVNLMPPPIVEGGQAATFDEVVAALTRLTAFAKARGIQLLIENHCELTSTPDDVIRLLDAVGPDLGLIVDTGNIEPVQATVVAGFLSGQPFEYVPDLTDVETFIRELAARAAVVHIKTYGFDDEGNSKVYDLGSVIDTVASTGYRGPVTIECAEFDAENVYNTISRTKDLVTERFAAAV